MTPLKAVRKRCLDCANTEGGVRNCPGNELQNWQNNGSHECALYPHRFGKGRIKLKTIREFCCDCQCVTKMKKGLCIQVDCPLYPYHLGKNPARKGIGGNPAWEERSNPPENL